MKRFFYSVYCYGLIAMCVFCYVKACSLGEFDAPGKSVFQIGARQLEQMGYRDIQDAGFDIFCCGKSEIRSTGFRAKDSRGRPVTGCMCSGIFKGVTIRFN